MVRTLFTLLFIYLFIYLPWQTLPDVAKITFFGCRRMNHSRRRREIREKRNTNGLHVRHNFEEGNLLFVLFNVG